MDNNKKKRLINRDNFEIFFSGIFGTIAICAVIAEVIINGTTADVIAGAVKDAAGTFAAVMVFAVALKSYMKKEEVSEPFVVRFENALTHWINDHSNMLIKSSQTTDKYAIHMSVKTEQFFDNYAIESESAPNAGWFVRMPLVSEQNYNNGDVIVLFHLNEGTFFKGMGLTKEELKARYNKLADKLIIFLKNRYGGAVDAKYTDSKAEILVTYHNTVSTDEEIASFIAVIDGMYQAYLVAANVDLTK